jgi:glutaredoxin-related protein
LGIEETATAIHYKDTKDTKNCGFSRKGREAVKEAMKVAILAKVANVLETPW